MFRAMFLAMLLSNLGTLMHNAAAAWVMGDLTDSPTLVALVQTAMFIPVLLIGIPAGAFADIHDRRRVLLSTQSTAVVVVATLTLLSALGMLRPWSLLLLTFALGTAGTLNTPAWQATQPDLVPRNELPQAISLGSMSFNVGRAIGPAVGGLLLSAAGAAWVFGFNALSFFGVLLVLAAWRRAPRARRLPAETLGDATRTAVRYCVNDPDLRDVLVRTFAFVIPAAALQALLPTIVRDQLDLGSSAYGALLATFGAGASIAAVCRPFMRQRLEPHGLLVLGCGCVGAALLVVGYSPSVWIDVPAMFVAGVGWTTAMTSVQVGAQLALPGWIVARGMAVFNLVQVGGLALASASWGLVAAWSLSNAYGIAAGVMAAGMLLARRQRLLPEHADRAAVVHVDEPVVAITPRPFDGPVLVTIAYRVPASDMRAFAAQMRLVEKYRRRTGAVRWGLFRDLDAPDRLVEMFAVRSWVEHLRRFERITTASKKLFEPMEACREAGVEVTHLVSAYAPGAFDDLAAMTDDAAARDLSESEGLGPVTPPTGGVPAPRAGSLSCPPRS